LLRQLDGAFDLTFVRHIQSDGRSSVRVRGHEPMHSPDIACCDDGVETGFEDRLCQVLS
jgi:hypothetical protein